jgi:hypothetical protein
MTQLAKNIAVNYGPAGVRADIVVVSPCVGAFGALEAALPALTRRERPAQRPRSASPTSAGSSTCSRRARPGA